MCDRENSLEEWCERLIPSHRVNKELAALKAKVANDSASNNPERDVIRSKIICDYCKSDCKESYHEGCADFDGRELTPVS